MKNSYFLITLIVVSLFLLVFVYPQGVNKIFKYLNIEISVPEMSFRLGLDLLGGAHLVYEADLSQIGNLEAGEARKLSALHHLKNYGLI
jgi:preprotein translocase subunit SecD